MQCRSMHRASRGIQSGLSKCTFLSFWEVVWRVVRTWLRRVAPHYRLFNIFGYLYLSISSEESHFHQLCRFEHPSYFWSFQSRTDHQQALYHEQLSDECKLSLSPHQAASAILTHHLPSLRTAPSSGNQAPQPSLLAVLYTTSGKPKCVKLSELLRINRINFYMSKS